MAKCASKASVVTRDVLFKKVLTKPNSFALLDSYQLVEYAKTFHLIDKIIKFNNSHPSVSSLKKQERIS